MKVDILAFGVHPDDIELSCSGTLLAHIAQGYSVGLCDLTRGELGTRGTPEIRDQEAAEAGRMMGAAFRVNLGMADGFFRNTSENVRAIVQVIRTHQPTIILANSVSDRHPDHGRAAQLVREAAFYAGLIKIETQGPDGNTQDRWRPVAVYHYIQDYNLTPDFIVDISGYIDRKMELVLAFRSQFYQDADDTYARELDTPISSRGFLDFLRAKAATYGRTAGFDYGEGFVAARTPGVTDLMHLA